MDPAVAADEKVAPVTPVTHTPATDAPATPEPAAPRSYTQDEVDRITAKVKKNASYRTRKEIEAYYQGRESARPAESPKPAQAEEVEKAPTRDQFDSYEEYLRADAKHVARQEAKAAFKEAETTQAAQRASEAQAKTYQSFQAKLRDKFPDAEERLESIGEIVLPNGVGDAIAESDLGPEILMHFADDPKDCERIAALSPSAALREIGKLEARLEAKTPATEGEQPKPEPVVKKQPSSAPAPIKPGGGTGGPGNVEPTDNDSIDDWMKKRFRKPSG